MTKKNKVKLIAFKVTKEKREEIQLVCDKNFGESISNYIRDLIDKDLKKRGIK